MGSDGLPEVWGEEQLLGKTGEDDVSGGNMVQDSCGFGANGVYQSFDIFVEWSTLSIRWPQCPP